MISLSGVKLTRLFCQFVIIVECTEFCKALPAWLVIGNHSEQAGLALKKNLGLAMSG